MKRWVICLAGLLGVGLLLRLPQPGTDVAQLEPVQVVLIQQSQDHVLVQTDTGAIGRGADLESAVRDLKKHALGYIFLDTADYVLLEAVNMDYAELYPVFRPGCRVCIAEGVQDLEQAGVFLQTHRPSNSLLQICAGETEMERLIQKKGALELVR